MRIVYEDDQILIVYKAAGESVQSAGFAPDLESKLKQYLMEQAARKVPSASSAYGDSYESFGQGRKEDQASDRTADWTAGRAEGLTAGGSGRRSAGRGGRRAEAETVPYLGIVHRLDQPVQGLLAFAKTPRAAADLSRQVTDGRMRKYYLAWVTAEKEPGWTSGTGMAGCEPDGSSWIRLEDDIFFDRSRNVSQVVPAGTRGAKHAVLEYQRAGDGLLRIRLLTGRHHQIRVQLAHAGMPILGDRKYGGSESDGRGLCLCACRLELEHPRTHEKMAWELREDEISFLRR